MRLMLLLAHVLVLMLLKTIAAEGACTAGGTCGPTNTLAWSNTTANVDGTALTNFAAFEARVGTAPGACTNGTLRDLGNFGLGSTPPAGTSQLALNAATLGLSSGPVFVVLHTRTTTGVRSACSAELTFTYDSATTPPPTGDTLPPSSPATVTATAVSTTQIDLAWAASTDNVGVQDYDVERCQGVGCTNFGVTATVTGTTFQHTGLPPATTYVYRVRARDAATNLGAYSPLASAATQGTAPPAVDTTPPTTPANFGGTVVGPSQINLVWSASTDNVGVTQYELERCTGAGCTAFTMLATPTGTGYNNTGLSAGTTYRYRVRAMDAVPNPSPYSVIVAATTQAAAPPVTKITVACSGTICQIEWPAVSGATSYRIARVTSSGWTVTATTAATNVNISWLTGVNEYGVFAIMSTGEAGLIGRMWTSK